MVSGSPLNALAVEPPFHEYHLIDMDSAKVAHLRTMIRTSGRANVEVYSGDCNAILLTKVFPRCRFQDFRRGLCLLDPYGLALQWQVVAEAGRLGTLDLFLNFPVMDMNRNALWKNPHGVKAKEARRMTAFWGDESWRDVGYAEQATLNLLERSQRLFGDVDRKKVHGNKEIVEAFRKRLRGVAGFKNVPEPLPMTNSKGAVVYYLFFASQKDVANKIVKDIFDKYRKRLA
jgi:three-Cys-motif partner protein